MAKSFIFFCIKSTKPVFKDAVRFCLRFGKEFLAKPTPVYGILQKAPEFLLIPDLR